MYSKKETIIVQPERLYNFAATINYLLKYRSINNSLLSPIYLIDKSLITAVDDAKEYLGITSYEFVQFAKAWAEKEEILFKNKNDTPSFYESWDSDYAKYNICANILNQHNDNINFRIVYNYFCKHTHPSDVIIDYGCGTGSLSFAFAIDRLINCSLLLLDVKNSVNEFVNFRIKKHHLEDIVSLYDVTSFGENNIATGIYCIDVLEHVENSSHLFIDKIHPLLKKNGLLYLKAPWRGQLTHLDEAADNFYAQGGRSFLSKKYKLMFRAGGIDVFSVYRKLED